MRSFRDLPDPGIEPMTPKLLRLRRVFTAEPRGKPHPYSLGLLLSAPLSTLQKPYNPADGSRSEFMTTDLRYAPDSAQQCMTPPPRVPFPPQRLQLLSAQTPTLPPHPHCQLTTLSYTSVRCRSNQTRTPVSSHH